MLLQIIKQKKEEILTVTSKEIAEDFGKEHAEVIYSIEGRKDSTEKIKNNGIINDLEINGISQVSKYFIESTYKYFMNRFKKRHIKDCIRDLTERTLQNRTFFIYRKLNIFNINLEKLSIKMLYSIIL
ncbi:hypothetical protein LF65_05685 [Clostridium beijerinckii]|uniref:Uncharacterized protein n=1 Tax=Clostridium beijerinckii TaxID=1520 RepID=A0A0B5QVK0_CLOBE|nr:hypothetical protein [Clostridium beijerinckii]AJH02192.1 hypothetical protein LF65_05685 [Clostridium beijerinckii]